MKTPKRESNLSMFDLFADPESAEAKCARWKRKNRIAQLKRSLHRYKHGTNLPFYCHELHAYLLLQELTRPSENASVKKWGSYILELSAICEHIEEAIAWAHYEKRRKQEEEAASACHPETAESGQQTDLPTKCGQQDRKEQDNETH